MDLHLAFRPFSFFLDNLDTKHSEHFTTRIIFYLIRHTWSAPFRYFQHLSTSFNVCFLKILQATRFIHRPPRPPSLVELLCPGHGLAQARADHRSQLGHRLGHGHGTGREGLGGAAPVPIATEAARNPGGHEIGDWR